MNNLDRRAILIESMQQKFAAGLNCSNCTGKCCTFTSNSMQITPLETQDIYHWLVQKNLWNQQLKENLNKTIEDYRLDYGLDIGGGQDFRRTYTCPFFSGRAHGCQLSPKIKPYGCLAFNPLGKDVVDGGNCDSDIPLLEEREKVSDTEIKENDNLRKRYNLNWEKLSIPQALMELNKLEVNK